jgi:SAM-dependent methyltransferase
VSFVVGSADRLSYDAGAFDYVFGYEVLYYVKDRKACANEITRVLKPGGTAVFCEALHGSALLGSIRRVLRFATGTVNRTGGAPMSLEEIERAFVGDCRVVVHPVNLVGLLKRLFSHPSERTAPILVCFKRCDTLLLTWMPRLRAWCGEAVIAVEKNHPGHLSALQASSDYAAP